MNFYTFSFFVFGLPLVSNAVKVNMQGSLSLGKDVMDTLSHYMRVNNFYNINSRRSFSLSKATTDTISVVVKSAFLCRDLTIICQGTLSKFLANYIIMLTKTVENIFEGLFQGTTDESENIIPKGVIFEEELKLLLVSIKKLLNHADKKLRDDDDGQSDVVFVWTDLMKKINAKYQERAIIFAGDRLQGNAKEINAVKQRLTQKIIIETSLIELEYMHKLCVDEKKCLKSFEITKSLKNLLAQLQNLPDNKTKLFIKYFYETLPDTSFYYKISEVTSNEFQAILSDMAYAENIHTKNVLLAVENTVDDRLNSIKTRTCNSTGRDVKLVHVILSDMDHFYSQHQADPFHRFMGKFYEWIESDARFSSPIRQVMRDIANTLSLESGDLVTKLVNEVRVFLEITVDPEK